MLKAGTAQQQKQPTRYLWPLPFESTLNIAAADHSTKQGFGSVQALLT
ncbi:hypothetical protein [Prochlorococcus marinus]|nr:hypothetical protein [Prochlorococcus marinus]